MYKYRIRGGNRIRGALGVCGGKNAALPILAATVLSEGESVIHNCPRIADIDVSMEILRHLGCRVDFTENTLTVNAHGANVSAIPSHLACKMRSSILFMGALLGRLREVRVCSPGGCNIGSRPIDLHLKGLQAMGAAIEDDGTFMHAKASTLKGKPISLREASVGATENLMLAAVLADGETILTNAAREPEIMDLARFLNSMGAIVRGAGTSTVRVTGVKKLHGATHRIMPDRIVTGTYLMAAAMNVGDILLSGVNPHDVKIVLAYLRAMGCIIDEKPASLRLRAPRVLSALPYLLTEAHPGFPTDMQAPFVAALSGAKGTSVIEERIFESRAAHAAELVRMGANITMAADESVFVIKGRPRLHGAVVESKDLRGGAALILAGLAAEGETVVLDKGYVARGYEGLPEALRSVGGEVWVE
ncbi:MAG: UDP-N-acetylglucosamine 1-carboxyvinyltransferase [Defluviitaleaceae bacterium]|nr:UDP-N-acetylglucosamine 1-carboxyvinyltransferase [Defluviitaleaceae bacterium]